MNPSTISRNSWAAAEAADPAPDTLSVSTLEALTPARHSTLSAASRHSPQPADTQRGSRHSARQPTLSAAADTQRGSRHSARQPTLSAAADTQRGSRPSARQPTLSAAADPQRGSRPSARQPTLSAAADPQPGQPTLSAAGPPRPRSLCRFACQTASSARSDRRGSWRPTPRPRIMADPVPTEARRSPT